MNNTVEPIAVEATVIEPTKDIEVTYTQAIIKDNLAAIEAYVDGQLSPYIGAVIDPSNNEQVSEGRTCMSDLNKLKAPIDAERKRIKREYEAPLKAFEVRVKAITDKIDSARDEIKKQVDVADEAFRANRRAILEEEFVGCTGPLEGLLSFERILDKSWLNRSTTETKALKGIQDAVIDAIEKYETLVASGLRHKDECVKSFCETLDLKKALALDCELVEKGRKLAEFKAAQEAANNAVEARREPKPLQPLQQTPKAAYVPPAEYQHRWLLHIEFTGRKSLAAELKDALSALGITGGTIKDMGVVDHV